MTINKQASIHGMRLFVDKHDHVVAKNAFVSGESRGTSIVLPGSPDTTAIFDDFHGDTLDTSWNALDGDTGATGTVSVIAGTNGIVRLALGSSPFADTGKGQGINGGLLSWKGNQGSSPNSNKNGLRFGVRLKMSGYTDTGRRLNVFAGFTDVTAVESPIHDSGNGIETNATDAFGFFYGAGADTGWSAMAVNNDVDLAVVSLDTTRQALRAGAGSLNNSNKYDTLEVVLSHGISDTGGTATFYVNGVAKGKIAAPVSMNVALTPIVYAWAQDTGGGQVVDIDWINVSAPRDTGI